MKYFEVLFEGHYDAIFGFLEGFIAGRKAKWEYFFSKECNVKTETLSEIFLEWISLKDKVHHIIIEEDFYKSLTEIINDKETKFFQKDHIKSVKEIKTVSFAFKATTYGKKYGEEIKKMVKNLPDAVSLEDYNPEEIIDEDGKGIELYAPEHDYEFRAKGRLVGDLSSIIAMHKKFTDYQLIEVEKIIIGF